ncbi:zinc transporter 7-like [Lineus longissimus]|uniref:zinc transporter 7-like n=1 Tax=Lineus longissimus TaxID=88925 RepID=UPI002B4DF90E
MSETETKDSGQMSPVEAKDQNGVKIKETGGTGLDEIRVEVVPVSRKSSSTGSTKLGRDEHDSDPHHLHHTPSQRDRHGETRGSYKRPHGESIHHHPHHCQSMKGHSHSHGSGSGDHHHGHGDSFHSNHNRDRPGSTRHTGHRHFESKRLANQGDVMSDKPVPDDYLANRPPQQLQDVACAAVCPHCKYKVWTKISYENGCMLWTLVILLTLIAFVPCALYLLFFDSMKDVVHTCPKCEQIVGVYKRSFKTPELRTLG